MIYCFLMLFYRSVCQNLLNNCFDTRNRTSTKFNIEQYTYIWYFPANVKSKTNFGLFWGYVIIFSLLYVFFYTCFVGTLVRALSTLYKMAYFFFYIHFIQKIKTTSLLENNKKMYIFRNFHIWLY